MSSPRKNLTCRPNCKRPGNCDGNCSVARKRQEANKKGNFFKSAEQGGWRPLAVEKESGAVADTASGTYGQEQTINGTCSKNFLNKLEKLLQEAAEAARSAGAACPAAPATTTRPTCRGGTRGWTTRTARRSGARRSPAAEWGHKRVSAGKKTKAKKFTSAKHTA